MCDSMSPDENPYRCMREGEHVLHENPKRGMWDENGSVPYDREARAQILAGRDPGDWWV